MAMRVSEIVNVLNTSTHEIVLGSDDTLSVVFNPHSNDSLPSQNKTPAIAVSFELTQFIDGQKYLGEGVSVSEAGQVPEHATQQMEKVSLSEIKKALDPSIHEIVRGPDDTLSVVFNPHSNDSPAIAVNFELTQLIDGQKYLGKGVSFSLAGQVPEYAAQHMEDIRFDISTDPEPTLFLEFRGEHDTEAEYFRRALTEMVENIDSLSIETEGNTLEISGNTRDIDALLVRLADESVEFFLQQRATNKIALDDPGSNVISLIR